MIVGAQEHIFPVFSGSVYKDMFVVDKTQGSCFSIGGGHFLTAGHTADNAVAGCIGWENTPSGTWKHSTIQAVELLNGHDLAIVAADVPIAKPIRWAPPERESPLLAAVETCGHPNTSRLRRGHIDRMAFRGNGTRTLADA
jgi:hypothetical protein